MRRQAKHSRGVFKYVALVVIILLAVFAVVISTVDIAGDLIAGIAQKMVKEQTGMQLSVDHTKGNPVKGYTFYGIKLASGKGEEILRAQDIGASVNFMSLLRMSPRLANLSVGGIDVDLNTFIEEISNIKMPESSGSSEIPIDRISLRESRFTSKWGVISVNDVGARINGTAIDLDIDGGVNGIPVKGNANANVNGSNVSVNKVDLGVGKGKLTSAGSLRPSSGPDGGTAIDFQGSLTGADLSELTAFWSELPSQDYVGAADVKFTIEGAGSNILITAALDYKGSKIGGYPLDALAAELRYTDKPDMRLTVDDINASFLGIPIDGSIAMAIKTGQVPSVMVKLNGGDAPMSQIAKIYPTINPASGKIEKFSANIQGPTNALSGTIELGAQAIKLMGKNISDLAVQVKLAKSDTATVNGKFMLEGAQAYIQGTIAQILTGARLDLTTKLVDLDIKNVADLIPNSGEYKLAGLLTTNLAIKGKGSAPSISGTISSPRFSAMNYTVDKPSINFAFANNTLTLKDSSGSYEGLPIKVSGTCGPLNSSNPAVNIAAQLAFTPANLKKFVPDIDSYKLKGNINAGVKVSGTVKNASLSLMASSPALSAMDAVTAKNIELTTAMKGDLTKMDDLDVTLQANSIAAAGVGLQNVKAGIVKKGQKITIKDVSAQSGSGSLAGGGTVTLAAKDAALDLSFSMKQLDLAPLAKSGGLGVALSGILSGKVDVKGSSSNPTVAFSGQSPAIAVNGITLSDVATDLAGSASAVKINSFKANVGGAPLTANGTVGLSPFKANLNISGTALDLASLVAGIPDMKGQLAGKADLKFAVTSTAKGNSGSGSITSNAVTAYGLKLLNVNLPLSLAGNTFSSPKGAFELYGGKAANSFTIDISSMKFSDTLAANGFDVNALVQDTSGGLGGKISGRGNLSLKLSGSAANEVTYNGSGSFSMGEGAITGFTGLNTLTKLYGTEGIRYKTVNATFSVQPNKVTLAKGGQATAFDQDPLYKYAQFTENSTVTFDKKLNIMAGGNINFQLINAMAGGALGGAEALLKGGGSIKDILSGKGLDAALKGAGSSASQSGKNADFRDVVLKITGTADKPGISIVKIGKSTVKEEEQTASADAGPQDAKGSIKDKIQQKIEDAVKPNAGKTEQPAGTAADGKTADSQPKDVKDVIKDKIQQKIDEAVKPDAGKTEQPQQGTGETVSEDPKTPEEKLQQKAEDEIKKGLNKLFKRK